MKTDTLLNLYQSYTLTKVSELNKQSLIALYAQNEQLSQLNEELARANRTTEQILRNQIKEIEQKEKRRYFKNMTFNLSQALDLLENEENVNFRLFASGLFLSPIRDMAKDAVQELEEIADKEYAQNIVKRTNVLTGSDKTIYDSYKNTPWATFLSIKSQIEKDLKTKKKEIRQISNYLNEKEIITKKYKEKEKKTKKAEGFENSTNEGNGKGCMGCFITTIVLLSLFTIGTYCTQDYYLTKGGIVLLVLSILTYFSPIIVKYLKKVESLAGNDTKANTKDETLENEIESLENEIKSLSDELTNLQQEETRLTTQYNELLQEITADCPKWESKLSEIAEFIPHKEKKKLANLDPLFTEAAKLIIKKKDTSISLIQRKFAIGYNRAARIMNQLEECGIVGTEEGSKSRQLLCESEVELSELIKALT
jgi:peptidoglycan hydrolase CwlO-like protein